MDKEQMLEKYKVISFDLYDTLINRDISSPKTLFLVCEREFVKRYMQQGITNYAALRAQCEQAVRNRYSREITYDQIFEEMIQYSDLETVNKYKEIEITAEIDFSTINEIGKELYEQCIKLKKKIIITTDMYLPRSIIETILKKNGYLNYDSLYLSSEIGLTKAQGSIYGYILKKEGIRPGELLHIGDNLKSDIVNAHKERIHSYYLRRQNRNKKKTEAGDSTDDILASTIITAFFSNRRSISNSNKFAETGYRCLGPLIYGFLDWIDNKCVENKIECILFFSRDGYLMKRIYEKMERRSTARFSYFLASRRALQAAAIWTAPSYDAIINSMHLPRRVKIGWLINNWGLDISLYQEQLETLNLAEESEVSREDLPRNDKLKALFDLLRQDIILNSRNECQAFLDYLREVNCHGRTAIVDIGWYGNMQKAFEKIINDSGLDISLQGYYLGIVPDSVNQLEYNMYGYLFQKGKNEWLFLKERYINCMLELFLTAPYGSLKRYYIDAKGDVATEQEKFEYQDSPIYKDIKVLQDAAELFVLDFKKMMPYIKNNELIYSRNMMDKFLYPSLETIKEWGDLKMWDGGWVNLIKCKNGLHRLAYLIHPHQLINDFLQSSWKIGFFKGMFGLPLPYADILILLRKKISYSKKY